MLTQERAAALRTRADMIDAGLSLDEQNDLLLEKLARLKMQIEGARAECAATGDYSDRDWYNRANFAYRMMAKEHQQCLREIGDRNKAQRKSNSDSQTNTFIAVARRRLDPDLFNSILAESRGHDGDGESRK